ncbi:MAG TPA: DNA mismatch repair protein MutS, partial [Candidatus Polarisedimenticolia bacterium]|nr:DNA mismatch repair protein MutS [Candidatus Polarisedimenticolia bacterium]
MESQTVTRSPVHETTSGPRAEYTRRLVLRRAAAARHAGIDTALSAGRLSVAIAAALIAWLALGAEALSLWWLAAPAAVFLALAVYQEVIVRSVRRLARAAEYYEGCLARLDDRWAGRGEPGQRFQDETHLFAPDLDLFGHGSLFELLCTARTRAGEETLAKWLRGPAEPGEIRARQEAVDELRGRLDLREDLALLGTDVRAGIDPDALASWGCSPPVLTRRAIPVAGALLAAAAIAALVTWSIGLTGPTPLLIALILEVAFSYALRAQVHRVVSAVDRAGRDLALLSHLLRRLEQENFTSPRLASLRAALDSQGHPPSKRIARLGRLIELLDARRNQLFAPLGGLLLWTIQIAHAIEAWRTHSGTSIGKWLSAVGEIEALAAIAGYAYEHPGDPFPEIVDGPMVFEAVAVGHPLLPEDRCVVNDVALGGDLRVLIVSGSNMSGKSTLLRCVGVNVVLAQAGAPVRARRLRLSPTALGASIRIQDSLQAGTSRFYAEITRLRAIVDATGGPRPVLFLIDEMLHGTNSHDRRIGAEAVVRGLIGRGAMGLVTTHDLALAEIAQKL